MGKSKPSEVASEGSDPVSRLARLPVVFAKPVVPFEGIQNLDIDVTGVVVPFRQVTIAAEVGGRVAFKSDACRIGRYVEAGEVLFKLDATDYQLEVERLAALRDSEYAQQKELDQEIANAQRSLELAEQEVSLQEKELQRLEKLPSGFASATELDQARRIQLTASTQRLTIQNQLEMIESRRTRIQLGERLAATQLSQAKVNLARTEVTAPISGVVVSEMVEQASYIPKGATLCMIHDTQRVEVSCNLRADQLMLILDQNDEPASTPNATSTSSDSYELPPTPVTVEYHVVGREESVFQWQGIISRYEGIGLNSQSRTIPIRVSVEHPRQMKLNGRPIGENDGGAPPALVQGMFIDCKIHTQPKRPLVLLPKLALRPGSQVWKFEVDPSVLDEASSGEVAPEKSMLDDRPKNTKAKSKDASPKIKLEEWSAGRVKIISNLRILRSIHWPSDSREEFWVAEASPQLIPGSLLVVSPMSNLIGDGTDKARHAVPKEETLDETPIAANESPIAAKGSRPTP